MTRPRRPAPQSRLPLRRGGIARALLMALLLALVLGGCAESTTLSPAASPPPATTTVPPVAATTQVRTFVPYRGGVLAVPVGARLSGTCWTTSITVPRRGVYRCLATNQIFDPCFAAPGRKAPRTVACFADPWSSATVITLKRALPRGRPALARTKPWALQLANGVTCVSVTGTVPTFHRVSLDYTCARGRSAGLADRSAGSAAGKRDVRHVEYGNGPDGRGGGGLSNVLVTVAWS